MKEFGLIGHPLSHSFSKSFFEEKFQREGLDNYSYHLFDILNLSNEFPELIKNRPNLVGLNVTIPYKEQVIPFLNRLDQSAEKVGAVNVIQIIEKELIGYNSDYYGFKNSLLEWFGSKTPPDKALVLGSGGASKAVIAALKDLNIDYQIVSRKPNTDGQVSYEQVDLQPSLIQKHRLIINTSPVGMYPNSDACPKIPYQNLTREHWLYDLVYNPEVTRFMELGIEQGANTKNGLEMLHLQAEKSWEIWSA